MVRNWILLVSLAVAIGSVLAQENNYWDGDYDDQEWPDEEEYDNFETNENDNTSIETDYKSDDAKTPDLKSDRLPENDVEGDENAGELDNESIDENFDDDVKSDDTIVNDSEQNDKAVKEEIEDFRRGLDEPVSKIADTKVVDDSLQAEGKINTVDDQNTESVDQALDSSNIQDLVENENDVPMEDNRSIDEDDQQEQDQLEQVDEQNNESNDNFDDYQVEDNRSDEVADSEDNLEADPVADDEISITKWPPILPAEIVEDTKNILEETDSNFEEYNELSNEKQIDAVDSVESKNENVNTFEESDENKTKKENEELSINFDEIIKSQQVDEIATFFKGAAADDQVLEGASAENIGSQTSINKLDDETNNDKEPENSKESNLEVADNSNDDDKIVEELDEDTVDKVYADLNEDLKQLFDTWDKLNDNSPEDENVKDYEEKYGRPFREDVVLSQRDDQDNYDENVPENIDSNLGDLFNERSDPDSDKTDVEVDDPLADMLDTKQTENEEKQIYDNDGLVADEPVKESDEETSTTEETASFPTIGVEELSSDQYNDLMTQFVASHKEELDTKREDFGKYIAPVHLTLTGDEVLEVTSPNYPGAYPTNNIVDWIIEGEGIGIEVNVTDLSVRGALGDYLLLKPGGVDESGHDGLVFSFELNEPRLYRFTDVDRMFVRFVSGGGWGLLRGFRMGVKMIWPENSNEDEEPELEPLLPTLPGTFTVNLGGLSVDEFRDIKDEFRRLVADMAVMYIHAYDIDMGVNTTFETTRIVRASHCNIDWPNFTECVEVTFGVPLVYEDGATTRLHDNDLRVMWETYVNKDPFAVRLRKMGIQEFAVPADNRVLTAWLVLATGVVVSVALLALALWRYSFFDNYTRMKSYSDTDSIKEEKKGLDLYPTPHQTLPSLYADSDYKWADANYDDTARVDLGGITNTGYMRHDFLDIDSDEDVVVPRNGYTGFSAREMYQV